MARIARTKRKAPSEIAKIHDELTAFEFDAACTYVYQEWKNKRDSERIILLMKCFSVVMGADPQKVFADDDSEAEVM